MKKFVFALVALLVILGCIFCAGCTSTPTEKYYKEVFSDLGLGDTTTDSTEEVGSIHTSTSSGSFNINGYTVSYESKATGDTRTTDLTIDNKKYSLKAPAQDTICGDWAGDNDLSITIYDDGSGTYTYPDSEYPYTFYWGKEDNGAYKFIFADNTIRTAELSQDELKDSMGIILKKLN